MEKSEVLKLQRAKNKVLQIKKWYKTIPLYIVATIIMLVLVYIMSTNDNVPNFILYVLLIGPVLWWLFLLFQGLNMFGYLPKPIKKWEEQKVKEIIQEEKTIVKSKKWE